MVLAGLLAAAAAWVLVPAGPRPPRGESPTLSPAQRTLARDAVLTVAVLSWAGPVWAIAAAAALRVVLPRLATAPEPGDAMTVESVLVASDFLAVCAGAGLTTAESLRRLAAADTGAASRWAGGVVARHAAGEPLTAALTAQGHASAADLCRVLQRAHVTGAPVADRLRRQARSLRRERRDETLRRVRGLSVRAVAPLGVCFLPAFILLAVVPLAASFATGLSS